MPVTAKLSKRFYEKFGDEVTNELVDWFNTVDATYHSDLRELNETNFARFDAKLEQRVATLDARLSGRMDGLEAKFEGSLDRRLAELREALLERASAAERRTMRWMFTFWTGTMLAMVGLMLAVLRSK